MRARDTRKAQGDAKSTQDRILAAATKVFAERGFKDATIRMICREAEVNVALVNYYFRSKAELYKAVIAHLFEDVAKPMMAIPDQVRDAETWQAAMTRAPAESARLPAQSGRSSESSWQG
jgi:AcrR family transcriptional regulator